MSTTYIRRPSADELRLKREDEFIDRLTDEELAELKTMAMDLPMIRGLPDFAKKSVAGKLARNSRMLRAAIYSILNPESK